MVPIATISITPDQDAILGEVHIAASPERVFQALSNPTQMKQWWGQRGMYRHTQVEIDLRPGGKWRSQGLSDDGDNTPFQVSGEYVEIDPPRLLSYTWEASFAKAPPSLVRWELTPSAGGTRVKMTHSKLAQYPEARISYSNGWPTVFRWMQEYLEKGITVAARPVFSGPPRKPAEKAGD